MTYSALAASTTLVRHERYAQEVQPQRELGGELTARLAIDPQTRADAFSIRHTSYLAGGYIDARPDGLFADEVDDLPNSQTIVVYKRSRPVASVRCCVLDTDPTMQGWDKIPASNIFPEAVQALMDNVNSARTAAAPEEPLRYARALEINRLVRHPDFKDDKELVFILFRFANYLILHHEADMFLSCVRRNHLPFYRRIMKMQDVAGPRQYHGVKFETHLMACDREKYSSLIRNVPIFSSANVLSDGYAPLLDGETVKVFGDQ